MRVGLETFLHHFSALLVEAAAGYRNFVGEEGGDPAAEPEYPDMFQTGTQIAAMFDEMDRDDSGAGSAEVQLSASTAHDDGSSSGPEEEVFNDDPPLDNEAVVDNDDKSMDSFCPGAEDSASLGSGNIPPDDLYGQSVGRISVHSVSRLMSDEDDGTKPDDAAVGENGSPEEEESRRADDAAGGTTIVQSVINFKSGVSQPAGKARSC